MGTGGAPLPPPRSPPPLWITTPPLERNPQYALRTSLPVLKVTATDFASSPTGTGAPPTSYQCNEARARLTSLDPLVIWDSSCAVEIYSSTEDPRRQRGSRRASRRRRPGTSTS